MYSYVFVRSKRESDLTISMIIVVATQLYRALSFELLRPQRVNRPRHYDVIRDDGVQDKTSQYV